VHTILRNHATENVLKGTKLIKNNVIYESGSCLVGHEWNQRSQSHLTETKKMSDSYLVVHR